MKTKLTNLLLYAILVVPFIIVMVYADSVRGTPQQLKESFIIPFIFTWLFIVPSIILDKINAHTIRTFEPLLTNACWKMGIPIIRPRTLEGLYDDYKVEICITNTKTDVRLEITIHPRYTPDTLDKKDWVGIGRDFLVHNNKIMRMIDWNRKSKIKKDKNFKMTTEQAKIWLDESVAACRTLEQGHYENIEI